MITLGLSLMVLSFLIKHGSSVALSRRKITKNDIPNLNRLSDHLKAAGLAFMVVGSVVLLLAL